MRRLVTTAVAGLAAAAFLGLMSGGAWAADKDKVVVDGSTTVGPIAKAFAEYYMSMNKGVNIVVSESGSGNGAKSLINGTCDIADMSRFMKAEEFKAAVDKGVTPVAHVIAMDGIALIVNPANPVGELTTDQIKDIYTGKVTNWKEVGGPDVPIVKISRDTSSGTYETFEEMVMQKAKMAAGVEYVGSNGAIRAIVQKTQAAVGYVGLGFVDKTVKAVKVNGIEASMATVVSGRYPIARPLYMFTNGYPKLGSTVHHLVTMYLTPKGQEIVSEIGFVPVTQY